MKADFAVRVKRSDVNICRDDIVFLETNGHYVVIHTNNGKTYRTRNTMDNIEKMLKSETFMRIHRCFMVNLKYVLSVKGNDVFLNSVRERVIVSRTYKRSLEDKIR